MPPSMTNNNPIFMSFLFPFPYSVQTKADRRSNVPLVAVAVQWLWFF